MFFSSRVSNTPYKGGGTSQGDERDQSGDERDPMSPPRLDDDLYGDYKPSTLSNPRGGGRRRYYNRYSSRKKTQVEPMVTSMGKPKHDAPMTKSDLYFALDCEMVGVGKEGLDSALARVSIVNWENAIVLDTFVKVTEPVTDYRTYVSGVSAADIESDEAMTFEEVRCKVESILRGKILIGHGLENDLKALRLTHPWCDMRDTATYGPLMRETMVDDKVVLRPKKLRDLAWEKLQKQIQVGGEAHNPIEDAIASLELYKNSRKEWEEHLVQQAMEKAREKENQRLRMKSQLYAASVANNQNAVAYTNNNGMTPVGQHPPPDLSMMPHGVDVASGGGSRYPQATVHHHHHWYPNVSMPHPPHRTVSFDTAPPTPTSSASFDTPVPPSPPPPLPQASSFTRWVYWPKLRSAPPPPQHHREPMQPLPHVVKIPTRNTMQ